MSEADVCVIMPTWNRANYLGFAIDSIGRQTADVRIELIVTQLGLDSTAGRDAAQAFLLSRCESLYWQRNLEIVRKLCALATELGFNDPRFQMLKRRASRPRWLLSAKDTWDRIWTPART